MHGSTRLRLLALLGLFGAVLAGCGGASAEPPAAPAMPSGWTVTSDDVISAANVAPVAEQLGVEISALRNTVYDVGGKRVQLNTLVVSDEANAGLALAALGRLKPEEFFFRRGLTVYEFVASDDAIADVRAARTHLEALPGG